MMAEKETVREVMGIFSRSEDLQEAIDELLSAGFDRSQLSLLASEQAVAQKLGRLYARAATLADDPTAPRAAYVSPEARGDAEGGAIGALMYIGAIAAAGAVVGSGGTLAAAIVAAAASAGAGGLIGSVLATWIGAHHARYLHDQIVKGGLLLWVRAWKAEDEPRAAEILRKHSGGDVHAHTLPTEFTWIPVATPGSPPDMESTTAELAVAPRLHSPPAHLWTSQAPAKQTPRRG
jgi:hypothetical protein